MNLFMGFFCIFVGAASLLLGVIFFFKTRKLFLNIVLGLNYLAVAVWLFGFGRALLAKSPEEVILWNKFYCLGAILFPTFFFQLVVKFFEIKDPRAHRVLKAAYLLSVFFILINYFTPFFIKDIYPQKGFEFLLTPRVFYYFFFLLEAVLIFYTVSLLTEIYSKTKGLKRIQVQYFFIATFLTFFGTLINFLTVLGTHIYPFGGFFIGLYPLVITYLSFEEHLMKVEFLYKKTIIYSVILFFILLIFRFNRLIVDTFFKSDVFAATYGVPVLSAILIILGFSRVEKLLEKIIDRMFFKEKYDYRKILLKASEMMTTILNLNHLLELIVRITMRVMKIEGGSILFFDEKIKGYPVRNCRGELKIAEGQILSFDNSLIEYLLRKKEPVIYEVLQNQIQAAAGKNPGREVVYKRIRAQLDRLGAALVIPSFFSGRLMGAFCLGEKKSGDPYTEDDIELLKTLANQAAIAVENAKQFKENLNIKNFTNSILKDMAQGTIVANLKGEIIVFNKEAEKITGFSSLQVLNRTFESVFRDYFELSDLVRKTIKNKRVFLDDIKFKPQLKKEEKNLTITSSLYQTASEDEQGVIVFIFDKTELTKAKEKIMEQQKLADFGLMAGGIAHDIKNPLSSIAAVAQLLIMDFNNKENQGAFKDIVPAEVERLKAILNSLSSYSSEVKLKVQPVNIGELLENRLKLVEAVCLKNNISLERHFGELPNILLDPAVMERVFHNIIFNAIQAMDKAETEEKILKVSTCLKKELLQGVEEELVQIEISDTGCGMDEKTLAGIFKPFFTTKSPGEGTGLGLALVEKYVKAHAGVILVESKFGQGSTFILKLPVNPKFKCSI